MEDVLNGPVILHERTTRRNDLDFLQNGLPELEMLRTALYFQQDGTLTCDATSK
jgi:hypothetical protein